MAQKLIEGTQKSVRGKSSALFGEALIDSFWETIGNGDYISAARLAAKEPKLLGRSYIKQAYKEALSAEELGQAASIDADYSVIEISQREPLYNKALKKKAYADAAQIAKEFNLGEDKVREHALTAYQENFETRNFKEAIEISGTYGLGEIRLFAALIGWCLENMQQGKIEEAMSLANKYVINLVSELATLEVEGTHPEDERQELYELAADSYLLVLELASRSYEGNMDNGKEDFAKGIGVTFGAPYDRLQCI
jgi:hypothetical protein